MDDDFGSANDYSDHSEFDRMFLEMDNMFKNVFGNINDNNIDFHFEITRPDEGL